MSGNSDGHWLEYGPVVVDYLKKVGGNAAVGEVSAYASAKGLN